VDLLGQRILEVWSGLPVLYLLIILSGFVEPNFWWLLGIMALFSWLALVDVVRAQVAALSEGCELLPDEVIFPWVEDDSMVSNGAISEADRALLVKLHGFSSLAGMMDLSRMVLSVLQRVRASALASSDRADVLSSDESVVDGELEVGRDDVLPSGPGEE